MLPLKTFRHTARGLPDLLNWAAVIDDGVVLGKDGALMAGWFYRGEDLASATPEEKAGVSAKLNAALAPLGSGWMAHIDGIRLPSQHYPDTSRSCFPDPITRHIEAERRRQFEAEGEHYESAYALILTYLPPSTRQSKLAAAMYDDDGAPSTTKLGSKTLAQFKHHLGEVEAKLSGALRLERLRGHEVEDEWGGRHVQDQLLQYLHATLSGRNHPINLPPCPMYLDHVIGGHELWTGITPKIGNQFIAVVALDGFPHESTPGMLDILDQLPLSYRWSTRFIFLDTSEAISHLKAFRRKWQQKVKPFTDQIFRTNKGVVDMDALSMVADTEDAVAEAASQLVSYGYYTPVIVLMDPDRALLEDSARFVFKELSNQMGFSCRVETINTVEAWLGSLPGHSAPNIRRPLLHTLNLADLLPLASIWPGRDTNPCPFYPPESPPLLHANTQGSTPFRLNLHVGDVGHTMIFGPTGAGKSTLLGLLAAQFRRYRGATVFCFDKGKSMYPLTQAVGGSHFDVAGDSAQLQFCPLPTSTQAANSRGPPNG